MSTTPNDESRVSTTAYDATTDDTSTRSGTVGVYGDSNDTNTPGSLNTPGVKVYDRPEGGAGMGNSSMMGIIGAVVVILIILALVAAFTTII